MKDSCFFSSWRIRCSLGPLPRPSLPFPILVFINRLDSARSGSRIPPPFIHRDVGRTAREIGLGPWRHVRRRGGLASRAGGTSAGIG